MGVSSVLRSPGLSLGKILEQIAAQAPYVQIGSQRTSGKLYQDIILKLRDEWRQDNDNAEPSDEQERAFEELARACTPFFRVPSIHAKVALALSRVTTSGWLLRRGTTTEATDVELDVHLEAAPLAPAAGLDSANVLPGLPEETGDPDTLTESELIECKHLMAGAEGNARVAYVGRFLSHPTSKLDGEWNSPAADYKTLTQYMARGNVAASWTMGPNAKLFRGAMRAILCSAFLVPTKRLRQDGIGKRIAGGITSQNVPTLFFLQYLRHLKTLDKW